MKAIKLLAFVMLLFSIQGCYTIIWTPDIDFPTNGKNDDSENYYDETYYGDYTPYYGVPWWYTVPPTTFTPLVKERSKEVTKLRNGGEPDRGKPDRPIIIDRTPVTEQPITTPPPSVSQPTTGEETSSKKTESPPSSRERGNSSNSRETRNNDGGRSSDTPRR